MIIAQEKITPGASICGLLAMIVCLAMVGGCDRQSKPASAPVTEPKVVLATVYPLADIARQIGGKRVTIEWFIESGQPISEVEATPERRNTARSADLVISRGMSEQWMLGGADDPMTAHRYIRLELLPSARNVSPEAYLWLDPQIARELSAEIAKRLAIIDPAGDKYFQDNCRAFQQNLDAICNEGRARLLALPQRQFLCPTQIFSAFALRFAVDQAIAPVDPSQALSLQRLRDMSIVAHGLGVKTIFVPDDMPPGVIRDLGDKVGLEVMTLDPLGTSAPSGRNTYLKLLQYNLNQLIAGLGSKPPT